LINYLQKIAIKKKEMQQYCRIFIVKARISKNPIKAKPSKGGGAKLKGLRW